MASPHNPKTGLQLLVTPPSSPDSAFPASPEHAVEPVPSNGMASPILATPNLNFLAFVDVARGRASPVYQGRAGSGWHGECFACLAPAIQICLLTFFLSAVWRLTLRALVRAKMATGVTPCPLRNGRAPRLQGQDLEPKILSLLKSRQVLTSFMTVYTWLIMTEREEAAPHAQKPRVGVLVTQAEEGIR